MRIPALGLAGKFSLLFAGLLSASLLVVTAYTVRNQAATIEAQVGERARAMATIFANAASNHLYDLRVNEIDLLVDEIRGLEHVRYAYVLDPDGALLTDVEGVGEALDVVEDGLAEEVRRTGREKLALRAGALHVAEPILFGGKALGVARLGLSLDPAREEIARQKRRSLLLGIGALVVTLVVSGMALARTARPLKELATATEAVSRGRFDVPIAIRARDEVGVLAAAFNRMLTDLNETMVSRDYVNDILRSMSELLVVLSPDGRIRTVNEAVCSVLGYREDELLGRPFSTLLDGTPAATGREDGPGPLERLLEGGSVVRVEAGYRDRHGRSVDVLLSGTALRGRDGCSLGMVCVAQDDRERKRREGHIRRLAYFDSVTELPNRTQFMQLLGKALAAAARHERKLAVMFLDLDRFKLINDTFGHAVGDRLLREFAGRLTGCVRREDAVAVARGAADPDPPALARLGGDEFTILLTGMARAADAAVVAERVLEAMREPFDLGGQRVTVATSVGIAVFPDDGGDPDTLLKRADTAMYHAKERGRANYQFYDERLGLKAAEKVTLEGELRRAVDLEAFALHYQPQIEIRSGRVIGVEALLRWNHPKMGVISPAAFVPLAEETGLIVPLGEWVLRRACRQAQSWIGAGIGPLRMAVNISAVQLRRPDFVPRVGAILAETGLEPRLLELEVTETTAMTNPEETAARLRELKGMGVQIAIDDFGTGYSSLNYLRSFPLTRLKIDRSFVSDIASSAEDATIVSAIIAMARNLRLEVIAEGVETEAQLSYLRGEECQEMQGYYGSAPLPPEDILPWLLEWQRRHRPACGQALAQAV